MGKDKKDKSSDEKSSSTKKRRNGDKKKTSPDENNRKYGFISTSSVTIMAESAGFSNLDEEAAKNLAEDVSYRLRSIIQNCSKFMRHTRQKRLSSTAVSDVLRLCECPTVYGYPESANCDYDFTYIKEADLFVVPEKHIDLVSYALAETTVRPRSNAFVTGAWLQSDESKSEALAADKNSAGQQQIPKTLPEPSNAGHSELVQKKPDSASEPQIPTNLIKYYGITCNTIIGHSDIKVVLQDLARNSKILPIVPYLLNFITITLNKLTSERQIIRLIQSVEALTENDSIDCSPYLPTSRVANAILMIIAVDKKISFDYQIRRYAAQVLSKVFNKWCLRDEQKTVVIKKMAKLLYDVKVSSKVHYGAIMLLTALGPEALCTSFFGILDQYLPYLQLLRQELGEKVHRDITMLEDAVLAAAVHLYRSPAFPYLDQKTVIKLDEHLYTYFGDSVCCIRLNLLENPAYLATLHKTVEESNDVLNDHFVQECTAKRRSLAMKYMNSRYKAEVSRPGIETVFRLPKLTKKRNPRILFKFAGAIPVPEINLRRRRMDPRCSTFIQGKESEGHVVVVGKVWRKNIKPNYQQLMLHTGNLFSFL